MDFIVLENWALEHNIHERALTLFDEKYTQEQQKIIESIELSKDKILLKGIQSTSLRIPFDQKEDFYIRVCIYLEYEKHYYRNGKGEIKPFKDGKPCSENVGRFFVHFNEHGEIIRSELELY